MDSTCYHIVPTGQRSSGHFREDTQRPSPYTQRHSPYPQRHSPYPQRPSPYTQRPSPYITSESTNFSVPPIPTQIDPSPQHQPTSEDVQPPRSRGRSRIDITSTDPKLRGRGYTGLSKGRPLGSKNKPRGPDHGQPQEPKKRGRPPGSKNKHPRGAHNDDHDDQHLPSPQPPDNYFGYDNGNRNRNSSSSSSSNSTTFSAPPQPQLANPGYANGYIPAPTFPQEYGTSTPLTNANNSLPTEEENRNIDPHLLSGAYLTAPPPAPTQPQGNTSTGLRAQDKTKDTRFEEMVARMLTPYGTGDVTLADSPSDCDDFLV